MSNVPNKFYWHEQRQVNVHDIPGIRYLPCLPTIGSQHGVTRIENGTFIQYIGDLSPSMHMDDHAWIFQLVDRPEIQFVVPANLYPYLWKVKRTKRR